MQKQRTKVSHYVPKCLTRAWNFDVEGGDRKQLRYYDVESDLFKQKAASRLLVLDEPLDQCLENLFERCLETPLSRYFDRLALNGAYQPDEEESIALKATVLLQHSRTADKVDDLVEYGDTFFTRLVERAEGTFRFVRLTLRGARLYFPGNGFIHVPMYNLDKGATAVPVHPLMLLVMIPRDHEWYSQQLQAYFDNDESFFVALTAGTPDVKKVIVEEWVLRLRTEAVVREEILNMRQRAEIVRARMVEANDKLVREGIPQDLFE